MAHAVAPVHTPARASLPRTDVTLIDCDVHNYPNSIQDLLPFLPERWQAYVKQSGFQRPPETTYPKGFELAARRDAWPPNGKRPGGDPAFAIRQLLDEWRMDYAVLAPLYAVSQVHNLDFANALMRAVNEFTASAWLNSDPRWRGSIVVNIEDPAAAAAEIARAAKDPRFVQVLLLVRSSEPYGRRRFHPIFKATCEAGLPCGIHFGGGPNPITACGWPSYYIEDHTGMTQAFEAQVISMVVEGLFEQFPALRVAIIEGGFAWLPPLMWRLDKNYKGLRHEVPWLRRLPSEYIREHFRATTQPMEEPANPAHLLQILDMLGREDFLMFATDYPHWDFDAPDRAVPTTVPKALRAKIMAKNANAFYDFHRA
ncbi:MAG: amidohydrolase [Actinobacteria bacterium]|nr:amidohydrolase [Actinomycetota bacterium]